MEPGRIPQESSPDRGLRGAPRGQLLLPSVLLSQMSRFRFPNLAGSARGRSWGSPAGLSLQSPGCLPGHSVPRPLGSLPRPVFEQLWVLPAPGEPEAQPSQASMGSWGRALIRGARMPTLCYLFQWAPEPR